MEELGHMLKTERIQNGVSINEASEDLSLSTIVLENIETGNVRAFKDVYELKEYVRKYSRYLGMDVDKVIDKFNDFLFEKTSKISLDDIREAQNLSVDKKKVFSPYTVDKTKNIPIWPFLIGLGVIVLICLIIYIIFISVSSNVPVRVNELFFINERLWCF